MRSGMSGTSARGTCFIASTIYRKRRFLENVVRVIKGGFKVRVGVGGQPVLFDEIDDFSQS